MPKSDSDQMESLQGNGDKDASPPTHCWIHSKEILIIICPRKFQNVRKNQLPFGQDVRNWFWPGWITDVLILNTSHDTWCPNSSMTVQKVSYPAPLCPQILAEALLLLVLTVIKNLPKVLMQLYNYPKLNWMKQNVSFTCSNYLCICQLIDNFCLHLSELSRIESQRKRTVNRIVTTEAMHCKFSESFHL